MGVGLRGDCRPRHICEEAQQRRHIPWGPRGDEATRIWLTWLPRTMGKELCQGLSCVTAWILHEEITSLARPFTPRLESQGWIMFSVYWELPSHRLPVPAYGGGVPIPTPWLRSSQVAFPLMASKLLLQDGGSPSCLKYCHKGPSLSA